MVDSNRLVEWGMASQHLCWPLHNKMPDDDSVELLTLL